MPGLAAGLMDNRTILEKADLALSDLTTGGGMLQPAQAQKFLRILINEAVILKQSTVVPMRSPKQLIEKIRFANRILRSGSEAVALPVADRALPNLGKVELDAQLFKAEVRLNNEVLEDSIERGQLRQTIMQLMAEAIARDVDEVIIQGDTTSADPFLAKLDGILKQSTSNIVDAQSQTTNKTVFRDMLKTMPHPFLRNKKELRFFTSVNSEIDYKDSLADRATIGGVMFVEEDVPACYSGVPVLHVPMFPESLGAGANTTDIVLTDPKNINVGIWRNIRVEVDKIVWEGVLVIVATLRFDVKYAEETAVVKAVNVKVGA
ncbi:MAG TPA: phage major capsid protein [Planctomycetota bacterium]|nr:phage major capsid protein [Planctomycetota bacterium]